MLFKLISIEMLKTRRSLALLMMIVCPLLVVALMTMMTIHSGSEAVLERGWFALWTGTNALWCHFMLPLYLALVTTLLNGNEHANGTWRVMLTLPIKPTQLYFAKVILAWLFAVGANMILFGSLSLSIGALLFFDYPILEAFNYPFVEQVAKTSVACLPVLMIQHALSWRFGRIVLPLAVGVVGTMGILTLGSSEYWIYYPWSYMMMSTMGSEVANQMLALQAAVMIGATMLVGSAFWLCRRESTV